MNMVYWVAILYYLLLILGILAIGIAIFKMVWLFMFVGVGLIAAAILFKKEFKVEIFPWRS